MISYHYSPYIFDKPVYEEIVKIRESGDRPTHENSSLGLWSCTFPKKVSISNGSSMFGTNAYKIKFKENIKFKFVSCGRFRDICEGVKSTEAYINLRNKYLEENIDVICVIDTFMGNGSHLGEVITLNFDSIEIFERIDQSEIKNHTYYVDGRLVNYD